MIFSFEVILADDPWESYALGEAQMELLHLALAGLRDSARALFLT
ncbi:MAG: hypothetical protein ABIA47_01340 [bacterium]